MKLDYASAIINLRIKLNLSQSALAELLGVSFTSVNRWENGKYEPTKLVKKKIELLCRENNIPEYLMLWMSREETQRKCGFNAWGSTRDVLPFEELCQLEIPYETG